MATGPAENTALTETCWQAGRDIVELLAAPNRLPLNWITPTQKPIKLYHQLCTLLYLEQSITPCMDLKSYLLKLFAEYPNIDLHAMGFLKGWQEETLWR